MKAKVKWFARFSEALRYLESHGWCLYKNHEERNTLVFKSRWDASLQATLKTFKKGYRIKF
jgi:hypothetical protein